MPTRREREYYRMGFLDGQRAAGQHYSFDSEIAEKRVEERARTIKEWERKPKRKLSAWNKFVKANSRKPRFRYKNGKLNLKKMGVAFRKTPAGRKKKNRRY